MLVHLTLVLMKIELVHLGAGANLESLDVACLISHEASVRLEFRLQAGSLVKDLRCRLTAELQTNITD